jgi:hypothetical protein
MLFYAFPNLTPRRRGQSLFNFAEYYYYIHEYCSRQTPEGKLTVVITHDVLPDGLVNVRWNENNAARVS